MKILILSLILLLTFFNTANSQVACTTYERQRINDGFAYMETMKTQFQTCCAAGWNCLGVSEAILRKDSSNSYYDIYGIGKGCSGDIPGYVYTTYGFKISKQCIEGNDPVDVVTNNPEPANRCGSIIHTSTQALGEIIPIIGGSFDLVYFSNRVIGRRADYKANVQLSGASVPSTVTGYSIEVKDDVGTVLFSNTYGTAINQTYQNEWSYADVSTSSSWASISRSFKTKEFATDLTLPDRVTIKSIGSLRAIKLGVGGWLPSVWRFYDIGAKTLYNGDGTKRNVTAVASGSLLRIAEQNGREVYYFDSSGKIVETKLGLTGTTIFTFQYNSSGRLLSITEPFSRITYFNRNSSGNLISITAPNSKISLVTLNSQGYLSSLTNPLSEVHTMTYGSSSADEGLMLTFTKPDGSASTMTYDGNGNLTSDTHSSGFLSTLLKTSTGVNATSAMGRITTNSFTAAINKERETKPNGYYKDISNTALTSGIATITYTDYRNWVNNTRFSGEQARLLSGINSNQYMSRVTAITNTNVMTSTTDPFAINTITKIATSGTSKLTSIYTGATKTFATSTKLGRTSTLTIDFYERPIFEQVGNLTSKAYAYTNEFLTSISHGTRVNNFAYNSITKLLSSVTNALGQVTSFTYDNAERLVSTTLPDNRIINYTYDSNGNLTSITPPTRPIHLMDYGINGKLESYTPPLLSGVANIDTQYIYNLDKQLTKIQRPDGLSINFNYNGTTAQLSTITGAFGTITPTFTNELLTNLVDQNGTVAQMTYSWEAIRTLKIIKAGNLQISQLSRDYAQGAGPRVSTETVKGLGTSSVQQVINYGYDDDEYLTSAGTMTLAYNVPNGQLTGTTLGSVTDLYTYNDFGEIATYQAKYGTTILYEYSLTRDAIGRVSQKVETLNSVTTTFDYEYDAAGRLIEVSTNGLLTSTYSYDENSNRIGGVIRGEITTASYDQQDRLTTYNGVALTYNANGEILTKGTETFDYDVFGNLKQYVNGATTLTYEIDPAQRRLGKIVNGTLNQRYMYNPEGRLIGQLNSTNQLVKTFVYGSKGHVPDYYIDSANNKFRIITDYLGSVRLVVNSAGVVQQIMEHDEFGRVLQDTNPGLVPFGFAGGLYDSQVSGLVRFVARDYDPQTARWTSKDPIGFAGGDTNLYGYVLQDPINLIDPSGNFWQFAIGAALGAAPGVMAGDYQAAIVGASAGALGSFKVVGAGLSFGIGFGSSLVESYIKGNNFSSGDVYARALISGTASAAGAFAGGLLKGKSTMQLDNFKFGISREVFRNEVSAGLKAGVGGIVGGGLDLGGKEACSL